MLHLALSIATVVIRAETHLFSRIERRHVNKLHIISAFDITPATLKLNVTIYFYLFQYNHEK